MKFKKKYLYSALFLVFLIITNLIIIQFLLFQNREDASLINVAGRQRMLSQRVCLMVYKVYVDRKHYAKDDLLLKEWKKSHLNIIEENKQIGIYKTDKQKIAVKLKSSFKKIEAVESLLHQEQIITKDQLKKINDITNLFLADMEIIVSDLEKFSIKKLNVVVTVVLLIALISLLVIYYEFKKVFLPIVKKLSQELVVTQSQYEELKQHELKILKQNETLRQIAWQQSHEVRGPVANILGLIDIIRTDKTLKPEGIEECLTYLFQATKELDKIIHKIVEKSNENEQIVNE